MLPPKYNFMDTLIMQIIRVESTFVCLHVVALISF